jgi:tRNA dimethylallyltransferase
MRGAYVVETGEGSRLAGSVAAIQPSSNPLLFLVGPTGAGKSRLALELAERLGAAIVSMDSMQVYRGMDIGTAKPGAVERERVPHHLLDRANPPESYDVRRYLADVERALAEIRAAGRRPLFVGGTGFYLKALVFGLLEGPRSDPALRAELVERGAVEGAEALHRELVQVDPVAARRIHPNDRRRVIRALEVQRSTGKPLSAWQQEWGWDGERPPGRERRIAGLTLETAALDRRIRERTRAMLDAGWPEEARSIRDGDGFGPTSSQALGYAEALALADGRAGRAEIEARIALRTRQFARRQRTWFRHFPEIRWLDAHAGDAVELALEALAG